MRRAEFQIDLLSSIISFSISDHINLLMGLFSELI